MNSTADAVILGAGIVGAACADALAREGRRVTIVEPVGISAGTTGTGMGHIVVLDDSPAQLALTRYSRELWNELAAELPPEVEYERCGTLWLAAGEEELAGLRRRHVASQAQGVRTELVDPAGLARLEPNLRPGLAGALLIPDDAVLYGPRAAHWLIERARRLGAKLQVGAAAVGLESGVVRLSQGDRIWCAVAVCAAGIAATSLFPNLPLRPRKGHLAITDRYPGFARHQIIETGYLHSAHAGASDSVAFNIQPRKTGQLLIGSSRQWGASGPEVEARVLRRMLQRAIEYMPALAALRVIRTWTGLRPASHDGLPFIGPVPGRAGVYLAAGHEGLGLTNALGTARLLADLIAGREPVMDPSPYLPSRVM